MFWSKRSLPISERVMWSRCSIISMSVGLGVAESGADIWSVSRTEFVLTSAVLTACIWFRLNFGHWGVDIGKRSAHVTK